MTTPSDNHWDINQACDGSEKNSQVIWQVSLERQSVSVGQNRPAFQGKI